MIYCKYKVKVLIFKQLRLKVFHFLYNKKSKVIHIYKSICNTLIFRQLRKYQKFKFYLYIIMYMYASNHHRGRCKE